MTALIYGMNYFTMKWIFDIGHIHPLAVLSMRSMVTTTLFVSIWLLFFREPIRSMKDLGIIAFCALTGVVINQAMFIGGVSRTTLVNASVLQTMSPVFVFLTAFFIGQEKLGGKKLLGLLFSLVGAAFLIVANSNGKINFGTETFLGDIMILVNAAVYGIYLVVSKPLYLKYNIFSLQAWTFLGGALINIPLGFRYVQEIDFTIIPGKVIFALFYFFIFSTVIAYLLYAWGLKHLNASSVSMYIYFQPIFVTLLSVFVASGSVTLEKVLWILLIFIGVFLVTSRKIPFLFKQIEAKEK